MRNILIVARKEIQEGMRNRWVLATTLLMAGLALSLTFLGSAPTGTVGVRALDVVIVSLSSLTIFLLPLIALLISPTMASCEISSAISGSRKIGRLDRLTITTSRARTPTLPVGALPRKVSERASAASKSVVARTQRLRRPSWISLRATIRMFLIARTPATEGSGHTARRGSAVPRRDPRPERPRRWRAAAPRSCARVRHRSRPCGR